MKNIAIVTDVPFWQIGLGKHARVFELFRFLLHHSRLTLYFLGEETPPFSCPSFDSSDKQQQLKAYLEEAKHDLVIVEYLHLHWVADLFLSGTKIYLDAIDLFSERAKSFASFNRKTPAITFEEEVELFRKFDKVMFLQKEELERVALQMHEDKLLLCPHPMISETEIPIQKAVKTISFLGSPSWPNIDGVQWFHDAVLPLLGDLAEKCIANGTISRSPLSIFSPQLAKGKVFASVEEHYKSIDIAINPVLYGSGLKIKTVEALAYGIPLVTTSVGSQGLLEEAGKAFLLADTAEEFAAAISALAGCTGLRRRISSQARAYAQRHWTPMACFGVLLN